MNPLPSLRLLPVLTGTVLGVWKASLEAGTDGVSTGLLSVLVALLALWIVRRISGKFPELGRTVVVFGLSSGVAFLSGKQAFAPAGSVADAICVGTLDNGLLRGSCLTEAGWEWRVVRVRPRLNLPGDRLVSIHGVLTPPPFPTNPGELNVARRSFLAGISSEIRPMGLPVVRRTTRSGSWWTLVRPRLIARSEALFGASAGGNIVRSMTVGDKAAVSTSTVASFRRSGLAHLLAISGFHVAIIGLALHLVFGGVVSRTPLSPRAATATRAALTTFGIILFAWITGGASSTVRAASMAVLLLGRRVLGLPGRVLHHILYLTAIAQVLGNPGSLFSPGTLLSFMAVFGLISDVRGFRSVFAVTMVAMLFTAPAQVHFFREIAPVGLLSNLAGGPIASGILVTSFFSLVLSIVGPAVAGPLALVSTLLGSVLFAVAEWFSRAPTVAVSGSLAPALVAALVIGRLPTEARGRIFISTTGVILAFAANSCAPLQPLRVTFLDVGQADAAVITLPEGLSFLVDTGGASGSWTLSQMLREGAISTVPLAVITHDHMDHLGGYEALVDATAHIPVVSSSKSKRVSVERIVAAGDRIVLGNQTRIFVLGPDHGATLTNDLSVVLLLVYGSTRILLLGDVEISSEKNLVRRWGRLLRADVVKVAHHGSDSSSSPFFVERVRKESGLAWAVVSVGKNNRYGLPKKSALAGWLKQGFTVLSTATYGAIECSSDGEKVHCAPYSDQLSR